VLVRAFSSVRFLAAGVFASAALAAGPGAPASAENGWATHRDPSGFIVDVPAGWALRYDAPHHKVTLAGADGARVTIRMVTAAQALDKDQAAAIGETLARDADPAVRWNVKDMWSTSPSIVSVKSFEGAHYGIAHFTWNSTPSMSVGYLYAETGPHAVLTADRPKVKRIWGSYRIALPPGPAGGAAAMAPAPSVRYAQFTEPTEHAFTVELPAAWAKSGGIFRHSAIDTRASFRAEVPKSIAIQVGDPAISKFVVPNATYDRIGYREGSQMPLGSEVVRMSRYIEGAAFAQQYTTAHFGSWCTDLQIASVRGRPDAGSRLDAAFAQYGITIKTSTGEAAFTCSANGAPMRGYTFAATQLFQQQAGSLWIVAFLGSYVAKAELSAQAHEALRHAIATYRVDPNWERAQQNTTMNVSAITTKTWGEISQIISDTHWSKVESDSRISSLRANANRGVQTAYDPVTKTTMTIDNRYAYNWIDHSGNIVGSHVSAQPSPDFRRLIVGP
jgi:hypothetical protein